MYFSTALESLIACHKDQDLIPEQELSRRISRKCRLTVSRDGPENLRFPEATHLFLAGAWRKHGGGSMAPFWANLFANGSFADSQFATQCCRPWACKEYDDLQRRLERNTAAWRA